MDEDDDSTNEPLAVDSRDQLAWGAPQILRCDWCGREVREGVDLGLGEERLCARCVQMVRDPEPYQP